MNCRIVISPLFPFLQSSSNNALILLRKVSDSSPKGLQFHSIRIPFSLSLPSVQWPVVVRLLSDCCPIVVRLLNGQQSNIKRTSIAQQIALGMRRIGVGVDYCRRCFGELSKMFMTAFGGVVWLSVCYRGRYVELTIFCKNFSPKQIHGFDIFRIFALDSGLPKRETFDVSKTEKLSKTENFSHVYTPESWLKRAAKKATINNIIYNGN